MIVERTRVACDILVIYLCESYMIVFYIIVFFFQAEDGIRDLVRSRGLGDVYKRQVQFIIVLLRKAIEHSLNILLSKKLIISEMFNL